MYWFLAPKVEKCSGKLCWNLIACVLWNDNRNKHYIVNALLQVLDRKIINITASNQVFFIINSIWNECPILFLLCSLPVVTKLCMLFKHAIADALWLSCCKWSDAGFWLHVLSLCRNCAAVCGSSDANFKTSPLQHHVASAASHSGPSRCSCPFQWSLLQTVEMVFLQGPLALLQQNALLEKPCTHPNHDIECLQNTLKQNMEYVQLESKALGDKFAK